MAQDYNGYSPDMSEEIQYAVKQIENEGYVSVENVSVEVEKELAKVMKLKTVPAGKLSFAQLVANRARAGAA